MTQYDRGLLKKADIEKFQKWLDGAEWRVGKGEFQLMQVKLHKGWGAICFDARGVISTPSEIAPLIKRFKAGQPRYPEAALGSVMTEDQYNADLRDDIAIEAMKPLLTGLISHYGHDNHGLYAEIASEAYDIAEAVIAERAKRVKK